MRRCRWCRGSSAVTRRTLWRTIRGPSLPGGSSTRDRARSATARGATGAEGEGPGEVSIRGGVETEIVRRGSERGMPAYGTTQLSDADLADLETYLLRFAAVPSSPD